MGTANGTIEDERLWLRNIQRERDALRTRVAELEAELDELADKYRALRDTPEASESAVEQTLRSSVAHLERELINQEFERDAYKRDFQAELDGNAALRAKYGALGHETMFAFLERVLGGIVEAPPPSDAGRLDETPVRLGERVQYGDVCGVLYVLQGDSAGLRTGEGMRYLGVPLRELRRAPDEAGK